MDRKLAAAIVGLGWWGRQIVTSLTESSVIDVISAAEPNMAGASDFADVHGLELSEGLDTVLVDPAIDAILIATPHALHEEQVLAAADAGKHVFCEKPLALTTDGARRMVDACRSRGLTLGIGHERRFEGALQEAARMATSGELGTLLHIGCNWSHNHFMGATMSGWRQDPEQAPAGTLTALGVHITDFFQSVCGPVATVRAATAHRSTEFPSDDVITVQFTFDSGVTGVMTNLATTPFYQRIATFGDRGWVEVTETTNVDVPEPALLTWRGMDREIHSRTYRHHDTVRANLEEWARAALGLGSYRFTDQQLVHNVAILEAIVRSTKSGRTETVG